MNRIVLTLAFIAIGLTCCKAEKKDYRATDIRIFKGSKVWKLAQAISEHDTSEMGELLRAHPDWARYKESEFGFSLLHWTVYNSEYAIKPRYTETEKSYYQEASVLIAYGADPYLIDDENTTVLEIAANVFFDNTKYLELCLNSKFSSQLSDSLRRVILGRALITASGKMREELDGVKMLVEAGANINYFSPDSVRCPIGESITQENMEITKYLIVEKKAKYDIYIKRMTDGERMSVLDRLKNLQFSDNEKKQNLKEEILTYIESTGK